MINEKIRSLKCYFDEKRKEKASKGNGTGTSQVYTSIWKFLNDLNLETSMLTVIPHNLRTSSYQPVNQGTFYNLTELVSLKLGENSEPDVVKGKYKSFSSSELCAKSNAK